MSFLSSYYRLVSFIYGHYIFLFSTLPLLPFVLILFSFSSAPPYLLYFLSSFSIFIFLLSIFFCNSHTGINGIHNIRKERNKYFRNKYCHNLHTKKIIFKEYSLYYEILYDFKSFWTIL